MPVAPPTYLREMQAYSLAELARAMSCEGEKAQRVLDRLLERGIVRWRTGNEQGHTALVNEVPTPDHCYVVTYVGAVVVGRRVIVCYPKYFTSRPSLERLQQVFRVLRHERVKGRLPEQSSDSLEEGWLSLAVRLIELYDERGVYTNHRVTRELNGPGPIDWSRTFATQQAYLVNGAPFYLDYVTRKKQRDDQALMTRLHGAIVSECSRFLEEYGLTDLLGVEGDVLTDMTPEDLGERGDLVRQIEHERRTQFVTWKQGTLDLMRAYLEKGSVPSGDSTVLCMGTNAFHKVWEDACKAAFRDMLGTQLGELPIELQGRYRHSNAETLLSIIPKPTWRRPSGEGPYETDTLEPDTVTLRKQDARTTLFCILDAKYYLPTTAGPVRNQPDLYSVTKQFLYQSAYREFVGQHDFAKVLNVFLVPSTGDKPALLAAVSFEGVMEPLVKALPGVFSDHIDMWEIPASEAFDSLLEGHPSETLISQVLR